MCNLLRTTLVRTQPVQQILDQVCITELNPKVSQSCESAKAGEMQVCRCCKARCETRTASAPCKPTILWPVLRPPSTASQASTSNKFTAKLVPPEPTCRPSSRHGFLLIWQKDLAKQAMRCTSAEMRLNLASCLAWPHRAASTPGNVTKNFHPSAELGCGSSHKRQSHIWRKELNLSPKSVTDFNTTHETTASNAYLRSCSTSAARQVFCWKLALQCQSSGRRSGGFNTI